MASTNNFEGNTATSLCQMFVIFRHGERSPSFIWPSDPDKDLWPNGNGSLTNKGKQQGYLVGKLLRKIHPGFLAEKYLKSEIFVHSTDTDRTLMTAQCCLAGLYPPKDDDEWLANMPWQPIPVHTAPRESDPLALKFEKFDFLPSIESMDLTTKDTYRVIADNMDVLKTISDKSTSEGFDGALFRLTLVLDAFLAKTTQGLPTYLPPGIDLDSEKAQKLLLALYSVLLENKLAKTSSVNLLKEILLNAEKKVAGINPTKKAFLYSGHDMTVNLLFELLKINASRATYGATLVVELHKNSMNKEYYIKLMYKDNIESPDAMTALPVNGLTMIPFAKFQKIAQEIIIDNVIN